MKTGRTVRKSQPPGKTIILQDDEVIEEHAWPEPAYPDEDETVCDFCGADAQLKKCQGCGKDVCGQHVTHFQLVWYGDSSNNVDNHFCPECCYKALDQCWPAPEVQGAG